MTTQTISTRCCIAGGGPAGMMLGLLLARGGIEVVVMEKHADFLNFLADQASRYPAFTLKMRTEVTGLIEDGGRTVGVRATTPAGSLDVTAALVIAADGRHSTVRYAAGLPFDEFGAPMDVFWFRISRRPTDDIDTMGRFDPGRIFIMINRGDVWQCGYVFAKGTAEKIREKGLPAFRDDVARLAPSLRDRVDELHQWEDVKLLTVRVDRLRQWYSPGLLCIGDAAHAMSPVGGVGINLAIQDAVAAANTLCGPLRSGNIGLDHLRQVQKRREFPTRVTQRMQLAVQDRVITRVLGQAGPLSPPLPLRIIASLPIARRLVARLIGLGVRPEHVRTPAVQPAR